MKGAHTVVVKNNRVQFKFTVERNITILRGDSATGKTTMIGMINDYNSSQDSGVSLSCDKKCVVISGNGWEKTLSDIKDSIVFIDEGEKFVSTVEFAKTVQNSDNYYVIATRSSLLNLSYSSKEIYGIKNKAGNRYQGTKRIYSEFFHLNHKEISYIPKPDVVIVEDSNAGFEFFSALFKKYGVRCISAHGNGNVYSELLKVTENNVLVIADGAAFGQQIERIESLSKRKNVVIYLPESFEWLVLKSGLIENVGEILASPAEHIESSVFYTWERFFTKLLVDNTQNSYLKYNKNQLNKSYLNEKIMIKISEVVPEILE